MAGLMLVSAVVVMVKAAEIEKRSELFWGVLTFSLCIVFQVILPMLPLINVFMGFCAAGISMFVANIVKYEHHV